MKMITPVLKNNSALVSLNCLLLNFMFCFLLFFFFPYIFPLSVDVRFFLKGSCFRVVIDSRLSLMGSFTYSVKTGIYSVKIEF